MSAFFSKFFTFFLKSQKNAVFALCCEISIAEVGLRFSLVPKCRSAIVELRCASTESKSSLRKLRYASQIKKIESRFCLPFYRLKRSLRFVALRFWYNVIDAHCCMVSFNLPLFSMCNSADAEAQ